jgi:hypothetical protein
MTINVIYFIRAVVVGVVAVRRDEHIRYDDQSDVFSPSQC